jgi:hypothetical protein
MRRSNQKATGSRAAISLACSTYPRDDGNGEEGTGGLEVSYAHPEARLKTLIADEARQKAGIRKR